MTRKQQLINEIADLIVERLDESSRLDELSPKKLKDIQSQIHARDYDIRLKKISGKIDKHYKVWIEREIVKPIINIVQNRLQAISPVAIKVEQDPNPYLGEHFKFVFPVSSAEGISDELRLNLTPSRKKGFFPEWARDFENDLSIIIKRLTREKSKRNVNIPLTEDEIEVKDRILILISKLLNKPDIVDGAKIFAKD